MPRTQDSRRIAKSPGTGSPPPSRAERNPSSTLEISRGSIGAFIRPIIVRSDALVDRKYLHDRARRINIYRMQTTPTTSVYQRRFRNDWSNFPRYPIRDRLCPLPPVYLSLSLFAFFTFPLRPRPSFSIRLRHGSARTEWRKRNSRSSRDNEFSDVLFFRGDSEDRGGANGNVVGARGERRVAKSSGLNMHVTRRPCGTWRSGLFQAPRTQEVNTELVPACGNRRLQDVYVISPFFACISVDRPPASPPFAVSSSPPRALNLFTDAREERFIMPPLMDGRRRRENATRTRPRLLDPFDSPSTPKSSFVSSFFFLLFFSLLFFPPEPLSFTLEKPAAFVRTRRHTFRVATKRETLDSLALLPIEAE